MRQRVSGKAQQTAKSATHTHIPSTSHLEEKKSKKKIWQNYAWATFQPLCISGKRGPIYLSAYFKQTIFSCAIWNEKTDLAEKKWFLHFSSFWCSIWFASQIPQPSLPTSSPSPPPFILPSVVPLSLLTLPSLPPLPKMVCTPGLFSNYAPTFSEKVITIRDPFSFFCEKHKIIFVIVVPERRSRTKIMERCWSRVAPLLWMGGQVASINGITRGGVAFCTLRAQDLLETALQINIRQACVCSSRQRTE